MIQITSATGQEPTPDQCEGEEKQSDGASRRINLKMRFRRPALAGLAICINFSLLSAQVPRFDEVWRWVEFTTVSGLPSDRILDVVETGDSTVWAVTSSGLAWYDGFRWNRVDSSMGLPLEHVEMAKRFGTRQLLLLSGLTFYLGDKSGFSPLPLSYATDIAALPPNPRNPQHTNAKPPLLRLYPLEHIAHPLHRRHKQP